jgi:hypothetical protein
MALAIACRARYNSGSDEACFEGASVDETSVQGAAELREQLRAIPREQLDANQAFSIRMWRGLSWLERSESATDLEGQFISLWIAFNAIYGYLEDDGLSAPDHGTWQKFLADIVAADGTDLLGRILWDDQFHVLKLIDNKYLFRPFWLGQPDADDKLACARRHSLAAFQARNRLGILQELFERLYVLRQQVFHGAATSGSTLNRQAMKLGAQAMSHIMPTMIEIMIVAGPDKDWGEICFPPVA